MCSSTTIFKCFEISIVSTWTTNITAILILQCLLTCGVYQILTIYDNCPSFVQQR